VTRTERAARHSSSTDWPARLALFGAIAIPIAASVVARAFLPPQLVHWASHLSHGSSAWMFTAGWATTAFLPAAALVIMLDGNRRDRQLDVDPRSRPRAARGHAVPGRGVGHWIRRTPLILPILLAVVFAPTRGVRGEDAWLGAPGSDAFLHGWRLSVSISLAAILALLGFQVAAIFPGSRARLLRVAGPLVAAAPALALFGLFRFTS
jgi:hypothetical protein